MSTMETWGELARLLSDDPRVAAAVTHAIDDPAGYFREHEEALLDRGIDEPGRVSGVIALVDALCSAGEAASVDSRTGADGAVVAIAGLPRVHAADDVDLEEVALVDGGAEAVVSAANRLIEPAGVAIVVIDEGSDALPLVSVPADRVPTLQRVAGRVDVVIRMP